MPRLKKRYELIAALAVAQLVCLGGGLVVFSAWLHTTTRETIHAQVMDDNIVFAKTITDLIGRMRLGDIREDDQEWERAQELIRGVELPNDGYVCLYDTERWGMLCHPDLTERPRFEVTVPGELKEGGGMWKDSKWKNGKWKERMAKAGMHKAPMPGKDAPGEALADKPMPSKPMPAKPMPSKDAPAEAMASKAMPSKPTSGMGKWKDHGKWKDKRAAAHANGEITGEVVGEGNELEIVATSPLPQLGAELKVHQRGPSIEKAITERTGPILPVGLAVIVVLVTLMTTALTMVVRNYDDRLRRMNHSLEDRVHRRTRSLRKTRDAVIFGLAKLAESRDTDTGEHLERIRSYVTLLGEQLLAEGVDLDKATVHDLGLASSLHDIGKVGIRDSVLLKPGRLDPDERAEIERHAALGGECLDAIGKRLGEDDFLQLAKEIAFGHHEKWDGTGYPAGVSGEMIPLPARIVALADVYDALRSRRPYKEPMPHEKAKQILLEGRGSHFDPLVVEAFLACEEQFVEVSEASNAAVHQDHICQEDAVAAAV